MISIIPTKIEYCLRPDDDSHTTVIDFLNTRDQNYTFDELFDMNVTAYEILLWSASIDLAEQYQYYIDQQNKSLLLNKIFFNCTQSWFGSRCQYSFELNEAQSLLYSESDAPIINYTCYTFLECNRGGLFLCLDWREICDGRIDCLDDGVDEAQCFDLEINECKINEYRCHNGLCISKYYWESERSIAACLDQSDVWYMTPCPNLDLTFDLFHCEEYTCPPGLNKFSCGDGQCVEDFDECNNGRHLMLRKSMSIQGNLSHHCWIAMTCLTKIIDQVNGTLCEEFLQSSNVILYLHSCENFIQFPVNPVLFGHVRFLYRPKDIFEINITSSLIPHYICYDEQLCSFLLPMIHYESYTCQHSYQMGFKSDVEYNSWKSIIDVVKIYFHGCNTGYHDKSHFKYSSLYSCKNSSKYISKHRILDTISDCHLNDDEQNFELSCSINDPYRFKCPNEIQCRSPIFLSPNCPLIEAKNDNIDKILFNQICDRTVDILPQLIDGQNHTDETNCEHWPCNNIYTRCDGSWDCLNGEDEENCRKSFCPRHFLDCISPYNYTMICLPANQVRNGIIDCLGGLDELQLCQIVDYYDGISYRFRCLNGTACVEPSAICDFGGDSSFNDNETFYLDLCDEWTFYNYTEIQNILCRNGTLRRIPFTLETSQMYPPIENKMIDYVFDSTTEQSNDINNIKFRFEDFTLPSRCVRGIPVQLWLGDENYSSTCFCPPNYHGNMCQYQNQRVSLTLTLLITSKLNIYGIFVKLIDDDNDRQEINSYDQLIYVSKTSCRQSFNMYLLYSTRPKHLSKNYSVHIDVYDKTSLEYLASWYFRIHFHFLPVNRLAVILTLTMNETPNPTRCPLKCQEGTCIKYINEEKFFCRCDTGWSGAYCHIPVYSNDCSSDSLWVGNIHNRSICMCPLEKFGSRCLLKHSCPVNYCKNNGVCIVLNEIMTDDSYQCLCSEEFAGDRCERSNAKLEISFHNIEVSSYLLAYIHSYFSSEPPLLQRKILKKLNRMQTIVTLHIYYPFQIVFIMIDSSYYLPVLQQVSISNISTSIDSTRRCPSINELMKSEQLKFVRIKRIKLYHMLCQINLNLKCFFDESYMCLCTIEQYANCFLFDRQDIFQCQEDGYCQNGGQCLQDHTICPLITICICIDCFFGDRCQFYAKGIGLTLDDILRYQVRPNIGLNHQSRLVKVSVVFTMVLFFMGLINSILSFLTFRRKNSRKVGCGIYLFVSSINSALAVTMLLIKFWFVLLTEMNLSTSRSVLHIGCLLMEPLLKFFVWMNNWLNACVAIERVVSTFQGALFNTSFSRYVARRIVALLPFILIGSNIYECISRHLYDDQEEQRVWCVTLYSQSLHIYTTTILFFHFLTPFVINFLSALFIISIIARQRAVTRTCKTPSEHLKEQFYRHRHLIISPIVLVILTFPLVVISLLFRCVKTSRNPWLYLFSYFISFIPPTSTFIIYVLPSPLYKKEFIQSIKKYRQLFSRH
jgi:hypothetical protein